MNRMDHKYFYLAAEKVDKHELKVMAQEIFHCEDLILAIKKEENNELEFLTSSDNHAFFPLIPEMESNDRPFIGENINLKNGPSDCYLVSFPLRTRKGKLWGTLNLIDKKKIQFDKHQTELFHTLTKKISRKVNLRAENERLREKLFEANKLVTGFNVHAIIARTDKQGKIMAVNGKFCEISKYSEAELLGQDHRIINSGFHSKEFFKEMWRTIQSGQVWKGEIRNKDKNDNYYWVDTTIIPFKNKSGEIIEYHSIRYDITEKKEAALLFNETQKIAQIGGWELNVHNMETEWTHGVYDIYEIELGTKIDPGVGISYYAEHERARIRAYLADCIKEGRGFDADFEFITHKKKKKWVHVKAIPEFNNQGKVVRIIGTFQDITQTVLDRKEVEKQKALALHQSKLATIGELAAGVGHEINNPLAIIQSYVTHIESEIEDPKAESRERVKDKLEKINIAINRISHVVKGLRSFSRSDSSDITLFDPIEAMEESLYLIKDIYDKDGIVLDYDKEESLSPMNIHGNRGKFQQILLNLISNSKDATENQNIRKIDISLNLENDFLKIAIWDNGPGVSENLKTKIFDPFFTTKEINKGTGIGLSLAQTMAQEMGGRIKLLDDREKGCLFEVSFPIRMRKKREIKDEPLIRNSQFKARVLLVDDEEPIRDYISFILKDLGVEITSVSNGQEAFDLYLKEHGNFDLIISDLSMPEKNGIQLLEEIQALREFPRPKFILITGGTKINLEALLNDSSKGLDGFLHKPFDSDKVRGILEGCLKNKKS